MSQLTRTSCPDIEALRTETSREQTLQWLFIHRQYLSTPNESVLLRELPSSYVSDRDVKGRADLLAFDRSASQPILVELKHERSYDPLTGAVLELLYHWTFQMQHRAEFHTLLNEFGYEPATDCRLMLIAPQPFYDEAKRRSQARKGEFEHALTWIRELAVSDIVQIDLYSVGPNWQQQGIGFSMQRLEYGSPIS